MANSDLPHLTILLPFTACLVSLFVVVDITSTYVTAYIAAPKEIITFIDTVDFSIHENESYDRDVTRVQRLEDKLHLGKLLREIQKCGDELREELNKLVVDDGGTKLKITSRILWAVKKKRLEERVRRMDMLRMRFLVVYMGLVADRDTPERLPLGRDPEKRYSTPTPKIGLRPALPHALSESITSPTRTTPMRRLTTQAIGHNDHVGPPHRQGWMGVVAELQSSPLMHKRRESIDSRSSTSSWSPRTPRSAS